MRYVASFYSTSRVGGGEGCNHDSTTLWLLNESETSTSAHMCVKCVGTVKRSARVMIDVTPTPKFDGFHVQQLDDAGDEIDLSKNPLTNEQMS